MLSDKFIFLAIAFNAIGSRDYMVKTVRGSVQPNRVTWLLWAVVPLITFSGQVSSGVGLQSLQTLAAGIFPLIIFCASFFNARSYWRLGALDYCCGLVSVIAVIVWYFTSDPVYAIILSVLADLLAGTPTIVKSALRPETENPVTYLCAAISSIITLMIVPVWDVPHALFPIYLLIVSIILFTLSRRGADRQTR